MSDRRPYRRESEERRRDDLIAAALQLVAEGGPQSATVRAIATRAGVTPGLIRHYFQTKEELTRAAYRRMMDDMTAQSAAVLAVDGPGDPLARLAAFVAASLRPPVIDPVTVGLWAGFLHDVQRDPAMREVHSATYLGFRDMLQALIADLPRPANPARDRADAERDLDGLRQRAEAAGAQRDALRQRHDAAARRVAAADTLDGRRGGWRHRGWCSRRCGGWPGRATRRTSCA